jgi:hypothetical protein
MDEKKEYKAKYKYKKLFIETPKEGYLYVRAENVEKAELKAMEIIEDMYSADEDIEWFQMTDVSSVDEED